MAKQSLLQKHISANLSAGIWCIRNLRLVKELYEAANSRTENKISIMVIFCCVFNLFQYFFCGQHVYISKVDETG